MWVNEEVMQDIIRESMNDLPIIFAVLRQSSCTIARYQYHLLVLVCCFLRVDRDFFVSTYLLYLSMYSMLLDGATY